LWGVVVDHVEEDVNDDHEDGAGERASLNDSREDSVDIGRDAVGGGVAMVVVV
jgi:hypothetical protein